MKRRATLAASTGVLCAWLAGGASAAGTIDTTGAQLAAGAAATQGVVTIDDAAPRAAPPSVPRLQPLGGIGSFSSPLPPADRADGGAKAFAAHADTTLAAGEHFFSTFDVAAGVVVAVQGGATIHTTGATNVLGSMRGGSIRFDSGGPFTLGAGAVVTGDLEVGADGGITCGPSSRIEGRAVVLRAYRTADARGDIRLDGSGMYSVGIDVAVQAEDSVLLTGGTYLSATSGSYLVQAFGGDVVFESGSYIQATGTRAPARIEAAHEVRFSGAGSGVGFTGGSVRVRAFDGELRVVDGADLHVVGGSFDLGAKGAVRITDTAQVHLTSGIIRLTSYESEIVLAPSGDVPSVHGTAPTIELVGGRGVTLQGVGKVGMTRGVLRCEAHDGDVTLTYLPRIGTVARLEAFASGSIHAASASWQYGDGMLFSAESGTIEFSGAADVGGFTAVAAQDVRVVGSVSSMRGPIDIASYDGDVLADGVVLRTFTAGLPTSDGIRVESFAGDAGSIRLAGASILTGDAESASGDVTIAVHEGREAAVDDGFILPTSITARRSRRAPDRSTIAFVGVFDGGADASLGGMATLSVGDRTIPLQFNATPPGGRLFARGRDYDLVVRPARSGSSRAVFRLKANANLDSFLAPDGGGLVTLRLRGATFDVWGAATLVKGRFASDRAVGAAAPRTVVPIRCEVRPTPYADDQFLLVAAFAAGAPPAVAPDVEVRCGERFVVTVPGAALVPGKRSVFAATNPVPGVRRAVLDYARGRLTVETQGIEVGDLGAAEETTIVLRVALAQERRAVRVRLGKGRGALSY